MRPLDRLIATGSVLVILAGMILFGSGAMAVAQSSTDLQRQLDQLRAEVRDIRSEMRDVGRHLTGVDREGSAIARMNAERLAALEREVEWTRWIVRGNLGVGGGVLGLLLLILRRLNGQSKAPWREDEQ